jgi:TolB protein
VDVAAGGVDMTTLGVGQPFYFSWAPDGSQLLTHIGSERVSLLGLDGQEKVLAVRSGFFATPQWGSDGAQLLYSVQGEDAPQLVLADLTGAVQQVVTFFQAQVRTAFSLSPSGEWVAYTETESQVGVNSFGPLFVYNRQSEEFEQLSTDPVVAFFWSPTGNRLLYLQAELQNERLWFRLHVWDGEEKRQWERFVPSTIFFNQYLPFADQYAQNMRFWAPDGSAFVYAGEGEDGRTGIWVQNLDADAPQFVTEGLLASWSPR